MQNNKIFSWLLRHIITVFSCVFIITLGIVFFVQANPGTTTIGEDISTTNLTTSGNATIGGTLDVSGIASFLSDLSILGNATTTGNLTVSGDVTFPAGSIDKSDLAVSAKSKTSATFIVAASDSNDTTRADYVCDGTADEVEIQAAIDALPSSGGQVVLLEGNYNSDQITIPSNVILAGLGPNTRLKLNDAADDRFIVNSDRTNGNSNIVIENLYIDGNKDGQTVIGPTDSWGNAGSLDFRNVENLIVRNNTIVNAWAAGIETTLSENVIITGNRIDNSADDGIGINDQTFYATVSNNIITNAGVGVSYGAPTGIEVQDGSHDIIVSNNIIKDSVKDGIQVSTHDGSTACYNINIIGNASYSNTYEGIAVGGRSDAIVNNVTISGNSVSNNAHGINTNYATGVTISDNVSLSNGGGIELESNCTHIVVNSNVVRLNSTKGIDVNDTCSYIQISNNPVTDNGAAENNSQVGIGIDGDYVDVLNNISADTGPDTQQYGIVFYATASESTADGNRLYGNTVKQILDVGTNNSYKGNIGYTTENSGTVTISSGNTYANVSHGLSITPSINNVNVVPTNNLGTASEFWVSNIGASTFRINVDADPAADATFSWQINSY